jgi:hypothetical protein
MTTVEKIINPIEKIMQREIKLNVNYYKDRQTEQQNFNSS